ncbi:MAG: biopolymer transporter ExbD [Hyphomonadaceae bacterium]
MGAKISAPGHGGGKRGRLDVNSDPNVIPFIDVMLVLLIIFMIAAPIASVDVTVDMPDSRIMPSKRPPKPTWISLQDDGSGRLRTFVMNDEVSWSNLGQATYDAVNTNTPTADGVREEILEQRVYIRADATTRYKNVMRVMNELNIQGFTKVALVTEDRRR